jgi:hypothetical protein
MSTPSQPNIYKWPRGFNGAVEISWQPPSSNGGNLITNYIIESANIPYTNIVSSNTRKIRVPNLVNGRNYIFSVKAVNSFGNGTPSFYNNVIPGFKPSNPTNFNFSNDVSNSIISFSFNANANANIRYNTVSMIPIDDTGNILVNSSLRYFRSNYGSNIMDPVIFDRINTNYNYSTFVQSINSIDYSDKVYTNTIINPNLPNNGLKLWLDPYDLSTLTLSNNNIICWQDKSINKSNVMPIVTRNFRPTDVSGLRIWYDASDPSGNGTVPANSTVITTITDKSGNGFNATANQGATLITNGLNSKPTLYFNGSKSYNITYPNFGTSYTVFVVFNLTTITGDFQRLLCGTTDLYFFIGVTGTTGYLATFAGSGSSWNDVNGNSPSYTMLNNYVILSLTNNGSTMTPYANGSVQNTKNGTTGIFSNFSLGFHPGMAQYYNGNMAEILIYNQVLSSDDRQKIEGYLASKWGLQYNLPSIHPFINDIFSQPIPYRSLIPSDISGLQLWFDASDTSSFSLSGNNIITWNDKSGNKYNATGVNNPQYVSGSYVSFNGSNQYFTLPNNALPFNNLAYSYIAIVTFNTSGSNRIIFGGSYGSLNSIFGLGTNSSNQLNTFWWGPDFSTNKTGFTNGQMTYINSLYDGNGNRSMTISFDPNNITYDTTSVIRTQSNTNNVLGAILLSNEYLNGRIHELIVYNKNLSTSERERIEGYLAWKWSLQSSLPSNHTFKNNTSNIFDISVSPIYDSGNSLIKFTGTQYLYLPSNSFPTANSDYSIYFYGDTSNILINNQYLLFSGNSTANSSLSLYINNSTINSICGNNINYGNLILTANINNLIEIYNNNGNTSTYINGTLIGSNISIIRQSDTNSNNIIGSNRLFTSNLVGSIGEIIMYDRLLNNTEITKVKNYLQRKKNNISLKNLGNLVLWLDSSDVNYFYDANIKKKVDYNNQVFNWLDRSSTNNNAIYSNLSTLPTKRYIIQNNLDTLEFNQSYLTIPRAYYPLDAFMILKLDNISNVNGILGLGPNSNNYLSLSYNTQGMNAWAINGTSNSIISSFTETSSNFLLMEWSISANNNYIRKNGANINSIKTGTFSLPTNSNIIIGNNNGFDFSKRFTGYIGELIIFNRQLDDSERYPIEGYLAWKWGLQSFLANSHPYKNSAPYLFYKYISTPYVHFFPSSVSGLQLWLDSNDSNSFSLISENLVLQWRDKSGNSNHFNPSSGYATRTVDGTRNVVNFTSGPLLTSTNSISLTTSTRMLGVCRNTKSSAPFSMLFCAIDWGTDRSIRYVGNQIIGSFVYAGSATTELLGNAVFVDGKRDNTINTNTYHMWDGACPTNVSTRMQISSTFYGDRYFEGNICEILVYSSLSNEDYKKLQGYLAWKWGLQSKLASIHPYKNTNPNNITSSFVPTDLYNTALWLDASDSSTITLSGNNVIQWNDKSGSGLNVFKNISSPSPTYVTNVLNSKPVVNFVVGQFLETLSLNPSSTFTTDGIDSTIFLITIMKGDGVNNLSSYGLSITDNNYVLRAPWSESSKILDIGDRLNFNNNLNNQIVLFSIGRNGTNMFFYNNGSLIGLNTNSPLSSIVTNITQKLLIGSSVANSYDGYLAEFIIFKTALSTDERQKVEGYLAWKWGLNSNLPSNHPYKLSNPITISKLFLPTNISGLRLWIDAQDSSSVVLSGSTVVQLFDKSNNRYIFSGASGFTYNVTKFNTNYPSFYNNTQNANYTLGSNNSIVLNQPLTAFYVGVMTTAATNWSFIHDSTTSSNRIVFYNAASIFHAGNNMSSQNANLLFQNFIVSGYFNSNNSSAYNNGVQYVTGDVGTNNGTSLLLGNRYTLDDAFYGHLCEIILFDGILSTNDRQKVEGYLAWKWGLQNNLTTSHPYYNINIGSSVTYNIITENLILYLDPGNKSCYNGLSNTLFDLSSEKNNCTLMNSPTFSANDHGKITFNGTTQYIATTISNINRSFTFSIWVKFNSISGPQTFMCEDTNIPIQTARFYFQKPDSGTFANYINFKLIINDSNFVDVYGSAPLVINTWYNFSVSVSLNTIKMYTNGILNNTVNNNLSLIPFRPNSNMVINAGYFQDILVNYFNGESGSYLIYNRDLTDDEVLQNYNAMKMKYT